MKRIIYKGKNGHDADTISVDIGRKKIEEFSRAIGKLTLFKTILHGEGYFAQFVK
jgi:hypothetical protein